MAKKRTGARRSADARLGAPSLELVQGILKSLPGTHAASVLERFQAGDYKGGAELRVEAGSCDNPHDFALALLSVSLFRKYPGLPGASRKKEAAIEKWLACEEQCRQTNERIKAFRSGLYVAPYSETFRLARKKIEKLLGPFRWAKPAKFFNFGPGSTTRLSYSRRHLPFKFGESPQTTFDNLVNAEAVIGLSPVWCESSGGQVVNGLRPCFSLREASKVTTVPKDAFIDRVIAIEPDMNMFIQKGFGGYFRRCLRRVGVDLDDQTLNQALARSGSALGSLATLDLSSASDTVSYEIVKDLLPPDWFEALLSCRTHKSRLPSGIEIDLQKFSAMGNGFTFELESLIFWALCSSVCTETIGREGLRVSVYGDDIIVATADYERVVDVLEFAGFLVNLKKSHASGPYRESCGKHYFHGRDVTPITITKELSHVSKLLLFCNNLTRWAVRQGEGLYRHSSVRQAHAYCVGVLPNNFKRPRIPDGYGDGALMGSFDECCPRRSRRGWDGWIVENSLVPRERTHRSGGVATLAASLSKLEGRAGSYGENQRMGGNFSLHTSFHSGLPVRGAAVVGFGDCAIRSRRGTDVRDGRYTVQTLDRRTPCCESSEEFEVDGGLYPRASVGSRPFPLLTPLWRRDRVEFTTGLSGELSQVSEIKEVISYKLGKVFVKQWCDIGPWVP